MRLIDADALAKFIDYGHLNNPNDKCYSENDIREMIDMMPTQAPVIRCKDCKFLRFTGTVWKCQNRLVMMLCEPNDYCSRGERKENGV